MQTSLVIFAGKSHRPDPLLTKQFSSKPPHTARMATQRVRTIKSGEKPITFDPVLATRYVYRHGGYHGKKGFRSALVRRFLPRDIYIYVCVCVYVFFTGSYFRLSALSPPSSSPPRRFVPLTAISTLSFRCHRYLSPSLFQAFARRGEK